jgi:hypothetical protein
MLIQFQSKRTPNQNLCNYSQLKTNKQEDVKNNRQIKNEYKLPEIENK